MGKNQENAYLPNKGTGSISPEWEFGPLKILILIKETARLFPCFGSKIGPIV